SHHHQKRWRPYRSDLGFSNREVADDRFIRVLQRGREMLVGVMYMKTMVRWLMDGDRFSDRSRWRVTGGGWIAGEGNRRLGMTARTLPLPLSFYYAVYLNAHI
ncbi:hypothetical protein M8C21_001320, partial [Ambrosia artemisiifolia]